MWQSDYEALCDNKALRAFNDLNDTATFEITFRLMRAIQYLTTPYPMHTTSTRRRLTVFLMVPKMIATVVNTRAAKTSN